MRVEAPSQIQGIRRDGDSSADPLSQVVRSRSDCRQKGITESAALPGEPLNGYIPACTSPLEP